jgi:hypothetical protein
MVTLLAANNRVAMFFVQQTKTGKIENMYNYKMRMMVLKMTKRPQNKIK